MVFLRNLLILLHQEENLEDGVEEVDGEEGDGETHRIFFSYQDVNQQEDETRQELDYSGQHIAGHEFPGLFSFVFAQHDEHREQGDDEEEQHDERHCRAGILGKQPLE